MSCKAQAHEQTKSRATGALVVSFGILATLHTRNGNTLEEHDRDGIIQDTLAKHKRV